MGKAILGAIEKQDVFTDLSSAPMESSSGVVRSIEKLLPNGECVTAYDFRASDSASAATYGIRDKRNENLYIEFLFDLTNGRCVEVEICLGTEGIVLYRDDAPEGEERFIDTLCRDFLISLQDPRQSFGNLLQGTYNLVENARTKNIAQGSTPSLSL